jgi:hypothetical protein
MRPTRHAHRKPDRGRAALGVTKDNGTGRAGRIQHRAQIIDTLLKYRHRRNRVGQPSPALVIRITRAKEAS